MNNGTSQGHAAALPVLSDLLTNSRQKDERACSRLHHYRYNLGYRPIYEEAATKFGDLMHLGLERWWKSWELRPDDRLAITLDAVADAADAFERVKAEELLRGYHFRWQDEPYDVLGVEVPFKGPLTHPATGEVSSRWKLAGKLDVLVRDRRVGLSKLVEHKTSNEDISPGSEYWRRLRIDGQVSQYYEGAKFLGHNVAGCVYDVIGKPALRPSSAIPVTDPDGTKIVTNKDGERVRTKDGKKWRQTADAEQGYVLKVREETPEEFRARLIESIAENPAKYYQRAEVVRLESEAAEALYDTWLIGERIARNLEHGTHPRNPDSCARYGKTCAFFDTCTGIASLDDPQRFTRVANVHPELGEVEGD